MRKVVVIGTGGIGRRHIRGLIASGRAELTLVEPHDARRAEAVALYAPAAAHARLDEIDLGAQDLAFICAPAHVHVPLMRACVDAGLPFLVEKPLSVSTDGVDAIIADVAARGLLARIGYVRRIAPEVIDLRRRIARGEIGAVKLAYLNSSQEFPKYRPDFRTTYYASPEMGGGAIIDAATHGFDLLVSILGPAETVSAMHDRMVLDGTRTEDTALISIRFASGAMASFTLNQFQKRNANTMEFIGTAGNLMLDHSTLRFTDSDGGWNWEKDHMHGLVPTEAHEKRFHIQAGVMLDALDGKPDTLATLAEGRDSLAIALAAKRSWDERRFVEIAEMSCST